MADDAFDFPSEFVPNRNQDDQAWGAQSSQFHQMFAALGLPLDLRQTVVVATELAPGVFHLVGGSHNSLAVEQENGIVVVEAPLYPERSEAILTWAETQFPTKPVTHVIATHHHIDHAAGLRAWVAAGATVVVGAPSVEGYQSIFAAPSTVQPDTLHASPADPVFQSVEPQGTFALEDTSSTLTAHHIATQHSDDMLVVHVETADGSYLFVSDLYTPGDGGQALNPAWAMELLDAITAASLTVDNLIGGHGGVAPLSELQDFLSGG